MKPQRKKLKPINHEGYVKSSRVSSVPYIRLVGVTRTLENNPSKMASLKMDKKPWRNLIETQKKPNKCKMQVSGFLFNF